MLQSNPARYPGLDCAQPSPAPYSITVASYIGCPIWYQIYKIKKYDTKFIKQK